jgi:general stress protein CsbA
MMSNELKDALYEYNTKRSYNFVALILNLILLAVVFWLVPAKHFTSYWFVSFPAVFILSGLVFHLFYKAAERELAKEKNCG